MKHGVEWTFKTWTGFAEGGFVKHGFWPNKVNIDCMLDPCYSVDVGLQQKWVGEF